MDAAFLTAAATDEEEWAEETDAAASTPASRAAMNATQVLTMGATVTPNMAAGRNFSLSCNASFTLAAPTNCKVGQEITITVTHTEPGNVMAVNSAWKRRNGLGVLSVADNAVDIIAGKILAVNGSGVATYVWYDVARAPS